MGARLAPHMLRCGMGLCPCWGSGPSGCASFGADAELRMTPPKVLALAARRRDCRCGAASVPRASRRGASARAPGPGQLGGKAVEERARRGSGGHHADQAAYSRSGQVGGPGDGRNLRQDSGTRATVVPSARSLPSRSGRAARRALTAKSTWPPSSEAMAGRCPGRNVQHPTSVRARQAVIRC